MFLEWNIFQIFGQKLSGKNLEMIKVHKSCHKLIFLPNNPLVVLEYYSISSRYVNFVHVYSENRPKSCCKLQLSKKVVFIHIYILIWCNKCKKLVQDYQNILIVPYSTYLTVSITLQSNRQNIIKKQFNFYNYNYNKSPADF